MRSRCLLLLFAALAAVSVHAADLNVFAAARVSTTSG